jgi:hypothetical protein
MRTACRICPGQRPCAYTAIRESYPEVWEELLWLESRLGLGAWNRWDGKSYNRIQSFEELANRGEKEYFKGNYPKRKI